MRLSNCVILNRVTIKNFSLVKDSIIGWSSKSERQGLGSGTLPGSSGAGAWRGSELLGGSGAAAVFSMQNSSLLCSAVCSATQRALPHAPCCAVGSWCRIEHKAVIGEDVFVKVGGKTMPSGNRT